MFNSESGYSLADISAATGTKNDGWGSNGAWWIIILFLFMFMGWGNNGFGGNNASQGALTRGELSQDMNFQSLENSVRGIQSGLCDGFYSMNTGMLNGFNSIQGTQCAGFNGVTQSILTNTNTIQQDLNAMNINNIQNTNGIQQSINAMNIDNMQNANGIQRSIDGVAVGAMQNTNALQSQIADCCCGVKSGLADIKYGMATDTCAIQNAIQNSARNIIDNQNCSTRSILDFLVQDKISTLENANQELRLAASQQAQNNYLVQQLRPSPVPAFAVSAPYMYGNCGGCSC
jgi:hypothetical protein